MGTTPEQDPQRAKKLADVHERTVKDAREMVKRLGPHDTAGVLLGAMLVVLQDALGREAALALLRELVAKLEMHDGPPPGAQRN
jgi:hypothetical protein